MKLESSAIKIRARVGPLGATGVASPTVPTSSPSPSSSVRTFMSASSSSAAPAVAGTASDRSICITVPPPLAMHAFPRSQLRLAVAEGTNEHLAGARIEDNCSTVPSADLAGGDRQAEAAQGVLDRLGVL